MPTWTANWTSAAPYLNLRITSDENVRKEANSLRRTSELLDYLPKPEPSPNFTNRTVERLTAQRAAIPPAPARQIRPWVAALSWVAAMFLVAIIGYTVERSVVRQRQAEQERALDNSLVQDLHVIENYQRYQHADDIDFLQNLSEPDLFGDNGFDS